MQITEVKTSSNKDIVIELVNAQDYKHITKAKYWFNWKTEKNNLVYKLRLVDSDEILGLISMIPFEDEERFEIKLLAVSKENRGKGKIYEGIAGNLIAYACREAIRLFGEDACVSLFPKTELREHYIKKYGMLDAGWQLFLEIDSMFKVLHKYRV